MGVNLMKRDGGVLQAACQVQYGGCKYQSLLIRTLHNGMDLQY